MLLVLLISLAKRFIKTKNFFESLNDYGIKYDLVRIGEEMGDSVILGNLGSGVTLMTYENEMTAISAS